MARKKKSNQTDTTSAPKPPQTLEEAEAYLSKPTARQILDFYASSPYLYETAWAYRSIEPSSVTDLLDDSKPEDVVRCLPAEDILEIHDVLNVEQFRPGVIQWDELEAGKDEEMEVDHWITAKDIRLMNKVYNTSNMSEGLWTQAILGLRKDVVDRLFGKARIKDRARKRRLSRKKELKNKMKRNRMKRDEKGVTLSMQDTAPIKTEGDEKDKDAVAPLSMQDTVPTKAEEAEEDAAAVIKLEQTEAPTRVATNGSDSTITNKKPKHGGKKRRAEESAAERKENKKMRRAQKTKTEDDGNKKKVKRARKAMKRKKTDARNADNVTTIPSHIPPAQTENGNRQADETDEDNTSCNVEQQKEHDNQNKNTRKRVSFLDDDIGHQHVPERELSLSSSHITDDNKKSDQGDGQEGEHDENDDDQQDEDQDVVDQVDKSEDVEVQRRNGQAYTDCPGNEPLPSGPPPDIQPRSATTAPSTPVLEPTTLTPRVSRTSARNKSPIKSPYFASLNTPNSSASSSPRRTSKGTSSIPFPPLSAHSFGLIQEVFAHNPFHLLIAVQFLNKTRGSVAIPVIYRLIEIYPTPSDLAVADPGDIVPLIRHLGLQNQRAKKLVEFGKMWVACPPTRGKRYRTLDYPTKGAGKGIKKDEVVEDEMDDKRGGAWEVAHLPGVGAYAIDSWRIFCRDTLRGVAKGWDGESAEERFNSTQTTADKDEAGLPDLDEDADQNTNTSIEIDASNDNAEGAFEPEWQRVLPLDKELRAFLRWMWLKKYGLSWNPVTGQTTPASKATLEKAEKGGCVVEELELDVCTGEDESAGGEGDVSMLMSIIGNMDD